MINKEEIAKSLLNFIENVATLCFIVGISLLAVFITWYYVNPITPIEKALTIFGSIITLWVTVGILTK